MTNLEKFYPGKKLESFRLGSSALAHEPDSSDSCIDCMECPAFDYCLDVEDKTCIDTFEAWAKMEYVMRKSILLSIHPKWAEKIYSGEKTIEWRKNIPTADFIDKVFLYETAPVCRVTGCFDYNFYYSLVFKHLSLSLCPTAKVFIDAGCVPIEELKKYRGDKRELFGWKVKNPKKFDKPKTLADFGIQRAPQSWQYITIKE